ncbi:hypothetical protein PIB30_037331 [Stylosanthes scabra]|uniref:Sec-independent protein translocase protein TATB, chloroplastic n=1 Tax=Stylosanthes scabra TaxID=79078 RepID=A0ABU6RE90_9FABA|nr:hypothetical protein [Stylosanthes scabra]
MAMASPLSTSTVLLCSKLKGTGALCCSKLEMGGGGVLRGWCGLRSVGISGSGGGKGVVVNVKVNKGLWKGKVVYASLFGVGAPEALVIGVVALLVFGPKGLAEVARNLGKTLRAFQPTIRELQDVSREFKTTLQREIGLDDTPTTNTYNSDPNGTRDPNKAYSSEEYLKVTQEQLKASAAPQQQQEQTPPAPPKQAAATEPQPENPETDKSPENPETDKSPLDSQ